MIDFRYHVVSIVAVFLALALGLFLGSTTLQGRVFDDLKGRTDKLSHQRDALSAQLGTANDQLKADQQFDKALLPYAVAGRLSGQLVSVVSAPGTSDSVRKQVIAAVDAAGGTLSADVRLQPAITDPTKDAFLSALTDRLTIPGHPALANANGAQRAAAQLAAVLGVRPSAHAVSAATVDTVLSAYSTGKLLSLGNDVAAHRPGTLAIILTGPAPSASADPAVVTAQQDFVLDLARDLDESALGAVLAVPRPVPGTTTPDMTQAAANDTGLTDKVSTVSGVDTAAGQITTVFALAAQADGTAGRFGPQSQQSPLPASSVAP